jgi:hypothetical protein
MHFIRMEDYAKNTKTVLTDVLDFLDMGKWSTEKPIYL